MQNGKPQKPQKGQAANQSQENLRRISGTAQMVFDGYSYVLHDLAGGFKAMENTKKHAKQSVKLFNSA